MNDNEFELPPVEKNSEVTQDGAQENLPPIKQEGSERNPEYLPPVSTDDPTSQSTNQHASSKDDDGDEGTSRAAQKKAPSGQTLVGSSPQIADDVDLIEKEWVEKAKEIVEKTKDNPYLQNKAISEIKADYIQKRYNKQISKSED